MQRLITLFVLLCTLSSVSKQPCTALLTRDQMVSILVDLELAKSMACYYADDGDQDMYSWLFNKNVLLIYQAHDIDSDTFHKSYKHYLAHLESMQAIYEVVITRIEALKKQVE